MDGTMELWGERNVRSAARSVLCELNQALASAQCHKQACAILSKAFRQTSTQLDDDERSMVAGIELLEEIRGATSLFRMFGQDQWPLLLPRSVNGSRLSAARLESTCTNLQRIAAHLGVPCQVHQVSLEEAMRNDHKRDFHLFNALLQCEIAAENSKTSTSLGVGDEHTAAATATPVITVTVNVDGEIDTVDVAVQNVRALKICVKARDAETKQVHNNHVWAMAWKSVEIDTDTKERRKELGRGIWGPVFQGNVCGQRVAIKRPSILYEKRVQQMTDYLSCICTLHHPNIELLVGATIRDRTCQITTELLEETLPGALYGQGRVWHDPWTVNLIPFCDELTRGMAYLHSRNVVHGDLRPENVMFAWDGTLKIIEAAMGTAGLTPHADGAKERRLYCAPEGLQNRVKYRPRITLSADVYAMAVVINEVRVRQRPHGELSIKKFLEMVLDGGRPATVESNGSAEEDAVCEMIKACWTLETEKRPSVAQFRAAMFGFYDTLDDRRVVVKSVSKRPAESFAPSPSPPEGFCSIL